MKKKICPYCDQVMDEGMYCRGCRRIVLKPVIWDVDYYLNERHPADETSCQYHGELHTGEMTGGKGAAGARPKPARPAGQTKLKPVRPASGGQSQPGVRIRTRPRIKTKSIGIILILYMMILLASAGVKVFRSVRETSLDISKMFSSVPEAGTAPAWEAGTPEEDFLGQAGAVESELSGQEEAFASGVLSEDEVRAAGLPCNGYVHFDVGEEAAELFESLLDTSSFQWTVNNGSYNWSGSGYTWFDNIYDYELTRGEHYCGYALLKFDTADGRMHGIELAFENGEDMYEAADLSLMLFHELGILEEYQDGQSLFEEAVSGFENGMDGVIFRDGVEISGDVLDDGYHLMRIYAEETE